MKTNRLAVILILSAWALASPVTESACQGQTTSNWLAIGPSSDWFDSNNWTTGVPMLPGDSAQVPGAPKFSPTIGSTNSISLGRIDFSGTGAVAVNGNGSLTFSNPGVAPAAISSPGLQSRTVTIAPTLLVNAGELLSLEPATSSSFAFTSGFGNSTGDAALNGAGQVTLNGGSANWSGQFTVNAGQLIVNSISALGSASQGTVINAGVVTLNAAVFEPFTLQGGTLQTSVAFLDLNGPLHLPAGNNAVVRGPFEILGGTSGQGNLEIVATGSAATAIRSVPLNHQGGVKLSSGLTIRQFANFSIDNGYSGATEINNVTLDVSTPNGLGSVTAGTTVSNGLLRLHGGSREDVSLTDSTLALWSAETTIDELRPTGNFKLKNSTMSTYGEFRGAANYIVERPVQLDGGSNSIATQRGALTLASGVVGTGNLLFNPSNSFPINVTGPIQSDLNPELRGGPLRLLLKDAFQGELLVRNGGRLVIETDQHMSRVSTGTLVNTGCCSPSGNIEVAPAASLTAERVDMTQGLIRGTVHTPDGLRFDGFIGGRTISHFDVDAPVRIMAGEVEVDDTVAGRAPTRAAIHVQRTREASVFVGDRSATDADFYLNNGSGFNFGGALLSENDSNSLPALTLRGDIHLGSNGAHIGGTDHLRIQGQIYGGDLNLGRRRGTPGLVIEASPAAYTGVSRVYSGELIVAENGRLSNTTAIELFPEGRLFVDNLPSDGALSDRIADNIPIRMFGGELSIFPTDWGMNARERVGQIHLERGLSSLRGTHYFSNSLQTHADLVVAAIVRAPGAILSVIAAEQRSSSSFVAGNFGPSDFLLESRPQLVNGILPAWLTYGSSFTTHDQNGRVKNYDGPFVDLAIASETSIARPSVSGTTLAADKTIHALYANGNTGPVNLNGHTLTVGNGGVSGANLSNGVIRPGQYAGGELVFFGGNTVNAAIVDNGGPTSVVYAGDAEVGGINTYTGMTYIVGGPRDTVTVNNSKALPTGASIEIGGYAELYLRDASAYLLGDVAIRDGGTLLTSCCGNGENVSARSILLEGGRLAAPLVGNFPITKQSDGTAIINRNSPGFTGQVDVIGGTLQAGDGGSDGYLAFGSGTVNVLSGGHLALSPIFAPTNSPVPAIRLLGGSLYGTSNATDNRVNLRGAIDVVENSAIYLLDGSFDRPRNATIRIDGSIRVAAGKSVSIIGRPDSSQGLHVTQGFQFGNGSILAGNGAITAQVQIGNGAVLSPGLLGPDTTVGLLAMAKPSLVIDLPKSRMTWAGGGRYRWEINDAAGDAGAPFGRGWDVLRNGVLLDITATPAAPFTIELIPLAADGTSGAISGLVPHRQYRWLIAENAKINNFSATITGFTANKFAIDASQFSAAYPGLQANFWLDSDSDGIYLNSMLVPEPALGTLIVNAFGAVLVRRQRRMRSS